MRAGSARSSGRGRAPARPAARAIEAVVPAYLFLCLALGGSAQGIWANMVLQLLGLGLLAWAAASGAGGDVGRPARRLWLLVALALLLFVVQLVPLPPALWVKLPGRELVESGFAVLGAERPWQALSLAPYRTAATLLALLPPLAMLAAMLRLEAFRPSWLVLALLAGTLAGVFLGILQVGSSDSVNSPWYLYASTNYGKAVGFFANANHMATLLLVAIPFAAALVAAAYAGMKDVQRRTAVAMSAAAVLLVLAIGLALNRSFAGYILTVPVLAASALILPLLRPAARRWLALATAALSVAAVAFIALSPVQESPLGTHLATSGGSRLEFWATTLKGAAAYFPFGSGIGSFAQIYPLFDDPNRLDLAARVPHAHNDYAELALETGLAGIALVLAFLAWWLGRAVALWRSAESGPYARAATIASAAILLHSLVDYPLRTAAIGACFAMCLALMAFSPRTAARDERPLWKTRHLALD